MTANYAYAPTLTSIVMDYSLFLQNYINNTAADIEKVSAIKTPQIM